MAIELKEAISILEQGSWVSLRFITANLLKGSGGEVIELPKCRIARNREPQPSITPTEKKFAAGAGQLKDPRHNLNFTRNVELPNKQIRKVHPILITHLNNQKVL